MGPIFTHYSSQVLYEPLVLEIELEEKFKKDPIYERYWAYIHKYRLVSKIMFEEGNNTLQFKTHNDTNTSVTEFSTFDSFTTTLSSGSGPMYNRLFALTKDYI